MVLVTRGCDFFVLFFGDPLFPSIFFIYFVAVPVVLVSRAQMNAVHREVHLASEMSSSVLAMVWVSSLCAKIHWVGSESEQGTCPEKTRALAESKLCKGSS